MTYMAGTTPLPRAIRLAIEAHANATDKTGHPFIGHPMRVMAIFTYKYPLLAYEDNLAAIALHDVVEDTETTLNDLAAAFPTNIVRTVDALSRRAYETYFEYIDRIIAFGSPAIEMKLCDISDNTDPRRAIEGESMAKRYNKAKNLLRGALDG